MKLGTCYICRKDGPIDSHHIIPQASGGEQGPTVDLCNTDHRKIHMMALNNEAKTKEKIMLFNPDEWLRAKRLVEYIILAIRKNRENPDFNNPYQLQVKLTKQDVFMLHLAKGEAGYTNLTAYVRDLLRAHIKAKYPRG